MPVAPVKLALAATKSIADQSRKKFSVSYSTRTGTGAVSASVLPGLRLSTKSSFIA